MATFEGKTLEYNDNYDLPLLAGVEMNHEQMVKYFGYDIENIYSNDDGNITYVRVYDNDNNEIMEAYTDVDDETLAADFFKDKFYGHGTLIHGAVENSMAYHLQLSDIVTLLRLKRYPSIELKRYDVERIKAFNQACDMAAAELYSRSNL